MSWYLPTVIPHIETKSELLLLNSTSHIVYVAVPGTTIHIKILNWVGGNVAGPSTIRGLERPIIIEALAFAVARAYCFAFLQSSGTYG